MSCPRVCCSLIGLAATLGLEAGSPSWWIALQRAPRLEARFIQTSESQVFGKLERRGSIRMEKGGRLRIDYQDGKCIVADGKRLVHYDPEARTAQGMDLRTGVLEAPLLKVLVDPAGLSALYEEQSPAPGLLRLVPRRKGLPGLELRGQGARLGSVTWTDPTGAAQALRLQSWQTPSRPFAPGTFTFILPNGARWLGTREP